MEQIDPNDLLVFARVVAEGSLTAAADKLGLPKSTVSRRLSRLEELLGERLLLRTTRRLNITEFGAALLDHARQLESEVEAVAALAVLLNVSGTSIEWGYLNSGVHDSQRDHEFDRATVRVVVESVAALDAVLDVLQRR